MSHFGANGPFKEVAQDLKLASGIQVSAKDAERVSERVGGQIEKRDGIERRRLRFAEPATTHSHSDAPSSQDATKISGNNALEDEQSPRI